jgi:hypothetical protein
VEKANSVEAEIDEILRELCGRRCGLYHTELQGDCADYVKESAELEFEARCQILSVVRKQLYGIDSMPAKMEEARFYIGDYHAQENYPNLRLRLTDDFFQALKNARRDGDESKNRV